MAAISSDSAVLEINSERIDAPPFYVIGLSVPAESGRGRGVFFAGIGVAPEARQLVLPAHDYGKQGFDTH